MKKFLLVSLIFTMVSSLFGLSWGNYDLELNQDDELIIKKYKGSENNVIIPEEIEGIPVVGIGRSAFSYTDIKSITISKNITSLNDMCFYYCSNLTSITLPSNITFIGENCFQNCSSLTSVKIESQIREIPEYCFSYCRKLVSVTLPSSIEEIGYYAFNYCESLESIDIPASVTEIGNGAFSGCKLDFKTQLKLEKISPGCTETY